MKIGPGTSETSLQMDACTHVCFERLTDMPHFKIPLWWELVGDDKYRQCGLRLWPEQKHQTSDVVIFFLTHSKDITTELCVITCRRGFDGAGIQRDQSHCDGRRGSVSRVMERQTTNALMPLSMATFIKGRTMCCSDPSVNKCVLETQWPISVF